MHGLNKQIRINPDSFDATCGTARRIAEKTSRHIEASARALDPGTTTDNLSRHLCPCCHMPSTILGLQAKIAIQQQRDTGERCTVSLEEANAYAHNSCKSHDTVSMMAEPDLRLLVATHSQEEALLAALKSHPAFGMMLKLVQLRTSSMCAETQHARSLASQILLRDTELQSELRSHAGPCPGHPTKFHVVRTGDKYLWTANKTMPLPAPLTATPCDESANSTGAALSQSVAMMIRDSAQQDFNIPSLVAKHDISAESVGTVPRVAVLLRDPSLIEASLRKHSQDVCPLAGQILCMCGNALVAFRDEWLHTTEGPEFNDLAFSDCYGPCGRNTEHDHPLCEECFGPATGPGVSAAWGEQLPYHHGSACPLSHAIFSCTIDILRARLKEAPPEELPTNLPTPSPKNTDRATPRRDNERRDRRDRQPDDTRDRRDRDSRHHSPKRGRAGDNRARDGANDGEGKNHDDKRPKL